METLTLHNRHTDERLELRRVIRDGQECLLLSGSLPPGREGPPLHIHVYEHEEGIVKSGTIAALLDGREIRATAGQSVQLPAGKPHRWWNGGEDMLVSEGVVYPAVDLDRYLQAIFEIVNAGPPGKPPLFYMAHAVRRHRRTQILLAVPQPVQAILFPLVILLGTILGKYRGSAWPGCPDRCTGAPRLAR